MEQQELYIGQRVYWHDPCGETSGEYNILQFYADSTAQSMTPEEDDIILIGDGVSEAEVTIDELEVLG